MLPKFCLILGSGNSISDGIKLGLSNYLENFPSFGINESIKFFDCTAFTFGDWTSYRDRFELYSKTNLVIGWNDTHIGRQIEGATYCPKHEGLILLPYSGKWKPNPLKEGLYSANLCGGFTLSLAIALGFTEIYLLGFDCREIEGKTHYYQGIEGAGQYNDYEGNPRTGVGIKDGKYNTSLYNNSDEMINANWKPFRHEQDISIFNVSPESRISVFPKISYREMFDRLDINENKINQFEVQKEIRTILEPYNKLEK
jgi:hypothetical protein